jgi:parallel beta-helix repeat protein
VPVVLAAMSFAACGPGGPRCGDVVTGDTELTRDLTECPGDGLVIGADGVRLDLNGHLIDGTLFEPGTAGVRNPGFDDVIIVNGRVTNFEVGVFLEGAQRNKVSGIAASSNLEEGLELARSSTTRLLENTLRANETGLRITGSHENRIVGNVVAGNDLNGVVLQGSNANIVERNRVLGTNLTDGIVLSSSDRNAVRMNGVTDNAGFGVFVGAGSDDDRVRENTVFGNGDGGVVVRATAARTVVVANTASDNGADSTSSGDGIGVDQPGTVVRDNTANDNADFGIEAVPGVADGGGNRAQGNGQPAQCLNVACAP